MLLMLLHLPIIFSLQATGKLYLSSEA